ncbi:MAG: bifunctional DNA-binding transcriptional regulator/O6-methylguanine-DNA methyltransferase Ada [Halopseudomonas sabulinigri]
MKSTALAIDNHEACWRAVQDRDAAADGQFIYAVLSTGVYCRPSCASRPARRENLRFFDSPEAAEQAGYRACLRCRPQDASAQTQHQLRVAELCRLIEQAEHSPSLHELAAHANLSPHHLHRVFKQATGLTPKAYANAVRQRRLADSLNTTHSITDAAFAAGFASGSRFYASADSLLGMTPSQYRAGGSSQQIKYRLAPCSLGLVLAAFSRKGICAILLGDQADDLTADLLNRFPAAECLLAQDELGNVFQQVVSLIEEPTRALDLPLDIRGTVFQRQVWQALQQIPPGETASYSDIAARIGSPRAVRAVASACAANPLALVVPCHRVLRRDGALSGYRWGLERKQTLLDREAATRITNDG